MEYTWYHGILTHTPRTTDNAVGQGSLQEFFFLAAPGPRCAKWDLVP